LLLLLLLLVAVLCRYRLLLTRLWRYWLADAVASPQAICQGAQEGANVEEIPE
jgi:hypothetical protein